MRPLAARPPALPARRLRLQLSSLGRGEGSNHSQPSLASQRLWVLPVRLRALAEAALGLTLPRAHPQPGPDPGPGPDTFAGEQCPSQSFRRRSDFSLPPPGLPGYPTSPFPSVRSSCSCPAVQFPLPKSSKTPKRQRPESHSVDACARTSSKGNRSQHIPAFRATS